MSDKDIIRISLYLPRELKAKIQEIAKKTDKTMTALIVEWCKDKVGNGSIEDQINEIRLRLELLEKEVFKK